MSHDFEQLPNDMQSQYVDTGRLTGSQIRADRIKTAVDAALDIEITGRNQALSYRDGTIQRSLRYREDMAMCREGHDIESMYVLGHTAIVGRGDTFTLTVGWKATVKPISETYRKTFRVDISTDGVMYGTAAEPDLTSGLAKDVYILKEREMDDTDYASFIDHLDTMYSAVTIFQAADVMHLDY